MIFNLKGEVIVKIDVTVTSVIVIMEGRRYNAINVITTTVGVITITVVVMNGR